MRPLGWTPCASDPECFDCRDCDALPKNCDYFVDASLRQEHAAKWRRRFGTAGASHELIALVEGLVEQLSRSQGVSASADLISLHARAKGIDLSPADAESGARASSRIEPTSPGMYRPSTRNTAASQAPLPPSVGEQMEAVLAAAIPLTKQEQLALFKRLAAYRQLVRFDAWDNARHALTEFVDETLPRTMGSTGWSMHDLYRYASGPVKLPQDEVGSDQLSLVLAAIHALEVGAKEPARDWAVEAARLQETLILRNLRLAAYTARRHAGRRFLWYADLFQEGCIGLMRAVQRFDPYRGNEFSTYAVWWIRQGITRTSADKELAIRLPVYLSELARKIRTVDQSRIAHGLSVPSSAEMAELAGEPDAQRISDIRRALTPMARLVTAERMASVDHLEELAQQQESRGGLLRSVAMLPQRERAVIELRYGLLDGVPRTLQAVGDELQLTRERIRQIERRAFDKLRPLLAAAGIQVALDWQQGDRTE